MAFAGPSAAAAAGSRKSPMTRPIASLVIRMFQCRSSTIAGLGLASRVPRRAARAFTVDTILDRRPTPNYLGGNAAITPGVIALWAPAADDAGGGRSWTRAQPSTKT